MKVVYKNKREEALYTSLRELTLKHGARTAEMIIQRLGEIDAAANPLELPRNARFHEHSGSRKGLFSVDLKHPFRLIFEPTTKYDNWSEISELRIYEVIDPHG